MRLAWLTDTHFNFVREPEVFWRTLAKSNYDAFLITGDVSEAHHLERMFQIWNARTQPVYFVLGNHDYYGSSIQAVRKQVTAASLGVRSDVIKYLGCLGVQKLTPSVALIGDDGWYDGRNGAYFRSDVELNDFWHIAELSGLDRKGRLDAIQKIADESAIRLTGLIEEALKEPTTKQLFIATHVAPWAASAWHEGKPSDALWQPFFSSQVIGKAIELAVCDSDVKVTVLCGHSHGGGTVQVSENIVCHTGAAVYRKPAVAGVFELA